MIKNRVQLHQTSKNFKENRNENASEIHLNIASLHFHVNKIDKFS